jgi:hypothetical protein
VGFAYTQFSNGLLPFRRDWRHLGPDNEKAFEMNYCAKRTGRLDLGGGLQVV